MELLNMNISLGLIYISAAWFIERAIVFERHNELRAYATTHVCDLLSATIPK